MTTHSASHDSSSFDFGLVAVLLGGGSSEREISLKSGRAVLASLERSGIAAEAIDPAAADGLDKLRTEKYQRVFIVLHGKGGEDGCMQGFLETLDLPYTGSGVLSSAISMDKGLAKSLWQQAGLPTPDFLVADQGIRFTTAKAHCGLPMMVKPVRGGSSIGASCVTDQREFSVAVAEALRHDREILIERWVTGIEYAASVLGERALPLIRLETPRVFYDYTAKYLAKTTRYHCPAGLDEKSETQLRTLAQKAFFALKGSGWGRIDLLVDDSGAPWLIESNTVPGMTDHSLVPMAAEAVGIDFDALVLSILRTSINAGEGA